ncbi:MAG: hypothetical protein ACP5KZ_06830 [bacterium]
MKEEKRFFLFSFLSLLIIPTISYPFGLSISLGFLFGIALGIIVFSYLSFLGNSLLAKGKKAYLWLSLIPRLAFLSLIALLVGAYQDLLSPLTFALGFAIIIFVMLFSHFSEV